MGCREIAFRDQGKEGEKCFRIKCCVFVFYGHSAATLQDVSGKM